MPDYSARNFLESTLSQPTEKRAPLPTENPDGGVYYNAIIRQELKQRPWQGKQDPSKSGVAIDLQLEVSLGPTLREKYKQENVVVFDSIMLDLTPDGMGLDETQGKNRRLGDYREAIDKNKKGDKFTISMLAGQFIRIQIKHEMYEGNIQERVGQVLRAK